VAEYLHFRDAAAVIGMSQPALSGAVSALEETLGVTLLERTTRKVLLSPAGERLAVRAKAVLEEVGALMEEAEAVRAPFTGVLRLGVIPTVAPYLLPTVLRLVHDRYPDLDLQVHEEQTANLVEGLTSGRLDLLLLAVPLGVPGVVELPLFDEDFVLVTPLDHSLGGREGIPREALRELNLLLLDEGHCLRDQALDICREAGREDAPVTTTAAGLSTLVQLVAGGLGVTLLPPGRPRHAGRCGARSGVRGARGRPARGAATVAGEGVGRGGSVRLTAVQIGTGQRQLSSRMAQLPSVGDSSECRLRNMRRP
jgi:LysR family hydrogen peroxide-inducible transcriptional activator